MWVINEKLISNNLEVSPFGMQNTLASICRQMYCYKFKAMIHYEKCVLVFCLACVRTAKCALAHSRWLLPEPGQNCSIQSVEKNGKFLILYTNNLYVIFIEEMVNIYFVVIYSIVSRFARVLSVTHRILSSCWLIFFI